MPNIILLEYYSFFLNVTITPFLFRTWTNFFPIGSNSKGSLTRCPLVIRIGSINKKRNQPAMKINGIYNTLQTASGSNFGRFSIT